MDTVACAGCGFEREATRSVCPSCGRLAAAAPPVAPADPGPSQPLTWGAPPADQPPAGQPPYGQPPAGQPTYGQPPYGQPTYGQPTYGAPGSGPPSWGVPTPPAPVRRRRRSGASPLIIVIGLVLGVGAYFVARNLTHDALSSDSDRSAAHASTTDGEGADESAAEGDESAAPAEVPVKERVPVSSGELRWTMREFPVTSPLAVPTGDGGTLRGEAMISEIGTNSGDLAIVYELEGRAFDLEAGLRGAVSSNDGTVIEGPNPVTVGGQSGLMVTATFEKGGMSGVVRYAGARFGDRLLVVGVMDEGSDPATGQQTFADIVASVQPG